MRRKHTIIVVLVAVAAAIALVAGGVWAYRHDRAMHAALMELQARNQVDSVFTSSATAQELVNYFDYSWHRANDQMLAYYLLGRAHADMGEAPQAIEAYQTAVERADTTDNDCDFRLLRNVYGQMAEVFHAQNLPEDELKSDSAFIRYSWLIGDTLQAINGYRAMECPYFLLNNFDIVQTIDSTARSNFLTLNDTIAAARAILTSAYINANNQNYDKAKEEIIIILKEADIFDEDNRLRYGYEMFYYTLGMYFEGINQLDSAEHYYRQVLSSNKFEAGYKGLLSVYGKLGIADSIAKFAPLYADANDAMHRQMNSDMVHQTNAQFQYARHQRLARQYEQQAGRRLKALYVTIVIILFLMIAGYYLYSRNLQRERKKEHALNVIQQKYIKAMKDYDVLLKEHEAELTNAKLQDQELQELREQKEQLELLARVLKERNDIGGYYADDIVQKMQSCAIYREKRPAAKDFVVLYQRFSEVFPAFTSYVSKTHALTENEWYVCILTDLGLGTNDIAFLMGQTPQRVNNIKRQVNHNLFGEDVSSTLQAKLRAAIHAG